MNTKTLPDNKKLGKILGVGIMVFGILCLNYFTFPALSYRHAFYRMLFYLPLVLGCFWFGIKGAMYVTASVFLLYIPYVARTWQGLTLEDFHKILEGLLFIMIAAVLGLLVEREKRKNKELLQIERLAALGRATSEVAHDMKTPLMAIGGFATQVYRKLAPEDPNRKKLEIIIKESDRLEAMIREMLEFGRPNNLQRTHKPIETVILESVNVADKVAELRGVVLRTELEHSLPSIPLDVDRLRKALLNLLTNAIEASEPRQCVVVKACARKNDVLIEIMDSGYGIKEEIANKVFSPFFTTKKRGTGLGLAIVKKTIEAHGGSIS
ncbi:MAG: ATP-binding protein, partial [Desulfatiglandaceae bacterium]